jgi:ring-1,2-phenylacetyl-CoA epoxidase subunit PaaE
MLIKTMSRFHSLKIKKITKETPECISVTFDVPEEKKTVFNFIQGQFLTLKKNINDEEIRRSYSICSCAVNEDLSIAIKLVPDGKFSSFANNFLKIGDDIEVMPPAGRFHTLLDSSNKKKYVAVAAGSGITPVMSLIKTILITEKSSEIVLLYGNKNRNSIIFKTQLENLKNKYIDRFSIYHILSREQTDAEIFSGRINADKINYFLNHIINAKTIDEVFICGPEEMIMDVKTTLHNRGVDLKNIHFELFGASGSIKKNIEESNSDESGEMSNVTIQVDGAITHILLRYNGETILDAALKHGADLPFACKGGVCTTCRAKLEKGNVIMDVNYGLEPDEIKEGFILTCQSHPRSGELVVNFDVK